MMTKINRSGNMTNSQVNHSKDRSIIVKAMQNDSNVEQVEKDSFVMLEDKVNSLLQIEEMEEEFMREINRNNQRLDAVIDCVKTLLKGEHKHKKFVSNLTTTVAKGKTSSNLAANTKLKSTNRLIERVENAIHLQQSMANGK